MLINSAAFESEASSSFFEVSPRDTRKTPSIQCTMYEIVQHYACFVPTLHSLWQLPCQGDLARSKTKFCVALHLLAAINSRNSPFTWLSNMHLFVICISVWHWQQSLDRPYHTVDISDRTILICQGQFIAQAPGILCFAAAEVTLA